jgi:hypothetical protein
MSHIHNFNNNILQMLHEVANSKLVANLKSPTEICDVLYPYVRAVIDDPDAYEESKKFPIYKCISEHVQSGLPEYKRMGLETSMCFTLYMYIYH